MPRSASEDFCIDEREHRLAEDRRLPHAGMQAELLQQFRRVVADDFDPSRPLRRDARPLLEFAGSSRDQQIAQVDVTDPRAALGFVHVMRRYEQA